MISLSKDEFSKCISAFRLGVDWGFLLNNLIFPRFSANIQQIRSNSELGFRALESEEKNSELSIAVEWVSITEL